jgi:hypothetical protein
MKLGPLSRGRSGQTLSRRVLITRPAATTSEGTIREVAGLFARRQRSVTGATAHKLKKRRCFPSLVSSWERKREFAVIESVKELVPDHGVDGSLS